MRARAFLLLLIVVVACFAVSAEAKHFKKHKSEVRAILKLLASIEKKISRSLRVDAGEVRSARTGLQAALLKYKKAQNFDKRVETDHKKRLAAANRERMLIRRIRNMILHDYGTIRHPGQSCKDILKFHSKKSGTFYIIEGGSVKRTFCSGQAWISTNAVVWKGGCASHSRGRGWRTYCTNRKWFSTSSANRYFTVSSGGVFTVLVPGYYSVHGWGPSHNNGWTTNYMQLSSRWSIGTNHIYGHSWQTKDIEAVLPFRAGDTFKLRFRANGGNPYRWHSWGSGLSGIEVRYVAKKAYTALYGCSRHGRSRGWQTVCLNRRRFSNTLGRYATFYSGGQIRIKRSGFFRLKTWAIQHGSRTHRRLRILKNGKAYHFSLTFSSSWRDHGAEELMRLRAGDRLYVQMSIDAGNRYNYHSWPYNWVQLTYQGAHVPAFIAQCSKNANGRKWRWYCLDRVEVNTMSRYISVKSWGEVRAKVAGVYRINAWANTYSSGRCWRHSQLWVQGKSMYYDHKWEQRWVNIRANGFVYLKRNQRVRVRFYTASSGHIYRGAGSKQSRFNMQYIGKMN